MSRLVDSTLLQLLAGGSIAPVFLAMVVFRSKTEYIATTPYPIVWNGNTFTGVGTFGKVGGVQEGTEVKADGMVIGLSGIDPEWMAEALTDIQALAPAKVWFGGLQNGQLVGQPYPLFSGVVDKPSISIAPETADISLALESRMSNLSRASNRRYTAADQHANGYPDDTAFNWVEQLNDISLRWGN